ncbi:hypothetical protein [Paraburkholderia rhizosphaerae]|uniref:hypothetical protein n=1 Tax=Paraburkholderia rhizosphaerae TaxID=480658 RepID=UPI00406BC3F7
MPSEVGTRSPACAASTPRLDTPTPFSLPTSTMRLAYMLPRLLTSIETPGTAPTPAIGVASSVSWPIAFAPATTFRFFA